ncbi:ubiquitin carboxyl-terminal hydrolase calypso [Sarcoptes scabiei]|nr:ubiquitin carboxyl-terminal hydrolase calypso [Sarcoptes scabiei]
MSDVGPCGICTEIYYLLEDMDLESSTEKLLKNSVEIWNIVFIQNFRYSLMDWNVLKLLNGFDLIYRDQNKVLHPLRKKFVDTGMGFERILSILQNVPNNYATDLFVPYFENISKTCKWPEYSHKLNDGKDIAYRIIADHCRMATVSIADGMFPNDRGSGYIVRRIIRRAIDSLKTLDKIKPLSSSLNESKIFSMLIDITVDILSPAFPEISQQCSTIHRVIDEEIRLYSTSILRDNLFNKYSRLLNIDLSEKFNINESNVLDKLLEIEKNLQKILSEMQDNLQIVENQLNQSARTLKIIEELIALNLANKFGLISEKITKKLSIVKFRLEEVEKELEKKSKELLRSLEIRDNAYDNGRRKNFTILSMETGKREKFLGLNYDYLSKIALDNYGHQPLALILQENSETILLQTSVPTSHTDRLNAKIWCDSSLEKLKEFYSFQIEPRSSKRLHKLCKYQIDHKSKDELIDSLSKILFTIAQKHFDFEK